MDAISTGILILLGAAVIWIAVRASRNSRHSPPTRIRGGFGAMQRTDDHLSQMGLMTDPKPPERGRDGPEKGAAGR